MISYPQIDPVFFRIGPLSFRWYGLMYAISFVTAMFLIRYMAARKQIDLSKNQISDLILYSAVGVILGGRVGYMLFYNPVFYLTNPSKMLAVWEGGMSFHGGFLGVLTAGYFFCRSRKLSYLSVADVAVITVPIGLGLGRLGNFINGELFGRETDVPWCMVFPTGGDVCRHPSQLYQAMLEGVVLFTILFFMSRAQLPRGVPFWSLFLFYGLFRFIVEFFREPDAQLGFVVGSFTMGQVLSLPMIIIGLVMVGRTFQSRNGPSLSHMEKGKQK